MPPIRSATGNRVLVSPPPARAFALVLSLTVMAMLLLLIMGLTALITMELRLGSSAILRQRARLNALTGAHIALGELQRTLGPDQRVSATADILCDPEKTNPADEAYYRNPQGAGKVLHPRWTGVWNTGAVSGEKTNGEAEPGSKNRLFQRALNGGYLRDSRFMAGGDWAADRTAGVASRHSPRLVSWLASGNEALPPADPGFATPYSEINGADAVWLVGEGTIRGGGGDGLLPTSGTDSDRFGARVRRVSLYPENAASAAGYAWFVMDEGVKARINLADPLVATEPSRLNPGNGGLSRLLLPRRNRFDFDKIVSPVKNAAPVSAYLDVSEESLRAKPEAIAAVAGFSDPATTSAPADFRKHYFHDLTFVSAGVLSDTSDGGLKKDLSAYLRAPDDIADAPGADQSGLKAESPIIAHASRSAVSPKFGLLKHWWANAPEYGAAATRPLAPTTFPKPCTLNINRYAAGISEQYTENIPDPAAQTRASRAPILAEFSLHPMSAFDDTTGGTTGQLRCLHYVKIQLWNPYSTPLRLANLRLTCRNWWSWEPSLPWGSAQYVASLPFIRYVFPKNLPLGPGESVLFVPDRAACVATDPTPGRNENPSTAFKPRDVFMKEGTPQTARDGYYIVSMVNSGSPWETQAPYPLSERRFFRASTPYTPPGVAAWMAGSYDDSLNPVTRFLLSDGDTTPAGLNGGTDTLGFLNFDSYLGNPLVSADWPVGGISSSGYLPPAKLTNYRAGPIPSAYIDNDNNPRAKISYKLRQLAPGNAELLRGNVKIRDLNKALDPTRPAIDVNPTVDANLRAPVQERHPFDAAVSPFGGVTYVNSGAYGSYINKYDEGLVNNPPSPRECSPFLSPRTAALNSAHRAVLFDTPFRDVGLFSLAQLRHAPLNALPFGPAAPFASGRTPAPSLDGKTWIDRTGFNDAELTQAWQDSCLWANRDKQVRQLDRLRTATPNGATPHDLFDLPFELNRALWDGFWLSGIEDANAGAQQADTPWETRDPVGGNFSRSLPDSRLIPAGDYARNTGYFATRNYRLYKPAHTLLLRGAFNVNSTSKVAWLSLLAATRNLTIPNAAGKSTPPGETPFPRVLRPENGPAKSGDNTAAPFAKETWSGYRALTDDELDRLAEKIVAEVKRRGPFLSLSDFVNRRLNPKTDFNGWKDDELNHLGTIESAIRAADLNKSLSLNPATDDMNRTDDDENRICAIAKRDPHLRSPLRAAGSPGCLEQGDVLQAVGAALTPRSDTFVIRVRDDCEGVAAHLELTVQRLPEPVIPGDGVKTLPVNPKRITADIAGEFAGNQLFGRRMTVIATRTLDASEL